MPSVIRGNSIGMALESEGLLPPHCKLVEVRIPASGAAEIVYTVVVDRTDLPKLARAMERAAGDEEPKVNA